MFFCNNFCCFPMLLTCFQVALAVRATYRKTTYKIAVIFSLIILIPTYILYKQSFTVVALFLSLSLTTDWLSHYSVLNDVTLQYKAIATAHRSPSQCTMALTTACLLLFVVHTTLGQLKWVEIKPSTGTAPSARRDAGIGYDAARNQIVIFGGRGSGGILDDTWIFNLTSKAWTKVSETNKDGKVVPENRFSMVYGSKGNYFYVSTGEGKTGSTRNFYDDINRFDFTTQKWEKLEPKTSIRPEKRYGGGGGVYQTGNGLYVTHGFAGKRYSNTFKFVFETQKWEIKFDGTNNYNPAAPHARCLHSGVMSDVDELVMYGGCLG